MSCQPTRPRLPPYSGAQYRPSIVCSYSTDRNVLAAEEARMASCLVWLTLVKSPPACLSSTAMPVRYCCCQPCSRLRHAIRATGSSATNRAIRSGPEVCRLLHGPPAKISGAASSSAASWASIESM